MGVYIYILESPLACHCLSSRRKNGGIRRVVKGKGEKRWLYRVGLSSDEKDRYAVLTNQKPVFAIYFSGTNKERIILQ